MRKARKKKKGARLETWRRKKSQNQMTEETSVLTGLRNHRLKRDCETDTASTRCRVISTIIRCYGHINQGYGVELGNRRSELNCWQKVRGRWSSRCGKLWCLTEKKGRLQLQFFGTKLCSNSSPGAFCRISEVAGSSLDVAD